MDKKEVVESNVGGESLLFVTEDSLFDVTVKYNENNGKILVDRVDDDFKENDQTKSITITIKYPSQGDCESIIRTGNKIFNNKETDIRDILQLEFVRLLVLARKWSLKKKINNESIMSLNPRIVRSIMIVIRENLGIDGII